MLVDPSHNGYSEDSGVSFTTFQLTGAAFRWWKTYEMSRQVGTAQLLWRELSILFLEKCVPQTRGEELRRQFEQLHQEDMPVTQYEMRFSDLARYVVWLVPTKREKIKRFINGLNQQFRFIMTLGNVACAKFDEVVDSARWLEMVHTQERQEREAKRSRGPAQSSSRAPSVQGSFILGSSGSYFGSRVPPQHSQPYFERDCYECGELSHRSEDATPAPVISPPAQPAWGGAQTARGRPRRGGRSGGVQAKFYAIPSRPDVIDSGTVITSIVSVFHEDASILFDPGSTYSYVSSYFAHYLDMPRESLVSHVHVSTSVGDTIIVDHVYRSCVVIIRVLETSVDLLLLSMVDFDVILGMDWLSPCHAIMDCHAKTVTLAMPGLPMIEWRGSPNYVPNRVISYLKAQRMVGKGYLSYLAFVRDVNVDPPTIDSVLVVRDVPDVFSLDLRGMPSDKDIDFGIYLVSSTQPISIPIYHMAPVELKELKERL
ncbi:uncharacterized protein [Nicotiana sylvestris]|uniref:uncharacterized protein n=1 Tax=Nicotiana sylvestris TaxID=4096 RepID=UPI00388CD84F